MRVLAVIDSLDQGGAEQSLAELFVPLSDFGVDLSFAIFREGDGPPRAALRRAGASVTVVGWGRGRIDRARRVRDQLRRAPVDLAHTTLFESGVAGRIGARAARTPVVSSLVNTAFVNDGVPAAKRAGVRFLDAATARLTCGLHAVSGTVADAASSFLCVPRGRITVVHRGRDPSRWVRPTPERRASTRAQLGIPGDAPTLTSVARHEPQKGLDLAVRAVAAIDGAHLVVAGREGSCTADVVRLIDALGVGSRIHLLGQRTDVADLVGCADLFLLTSSSEGAAGALLEAAALGVPAVVSDLPTLRESFPEGVTFVPRHEGAFVEAITGLLRSPERTRLASVARARFLDRFTIAASADAMAAFYRRSLERSAR